MQERTGEIGPLDKVIRRMQEGTPEEREAAIRESEAYIETTENGNRLLTLLLNNDAETKIPLLVGGTAWSAPFQKDVPHG
jgi:hypothetical protein